MHVCVATVWEQLAYMQSTHTIVPLTKYYVYYYETYIHTLPREKLLVHATEIWIYLYEWLSKSFKKFATLILTVFKYLVKPITKKFKSCLNVFDDF